VTCIHFARGRGAWARDGRHIVTEVEVRSTLRGAAPQRLTVLQRGGRLGGIEQRVSDEPVLVPKAHVVLACACSPVIEVGQQLTTTSRACGDAQPHRR